MLPSMQLESPRHLIKLPQPLDSINGRYHVADILNGPVGSQKRKRIELAVAVDGEGLHLYKVQPAELITSYALPPTSNFTCPPTSWRSRSGTSSVRSTYASIVGPAPRIVGFIATALSSEPPTSEKEEVLPLSHVLPSAAAPVIHLDVINSGAVDGDFVARSEVVVVHQDGEVRCLSGDLKHQTWKASSVELLASASIAVETFASDEQVEFAQITDSVTARKGLLQGRDDICALLDSKVAVGEGVDRELPILALLSVSPHLKLDRRLHLFAIHSSQRATALGNASGALQPLLTIVLPESKDLPSASLQTFLQSSAGTIQLTSTGGCFTYDLSGTVPRLTSRLLLPNPAPISFLRLSKALVMISTSTDVNVWGIKYQSRQATWSLQPPPQTGDKRKMSQRKIARLAGAPVRLVSYFGPLGLAIGIMGDEFVGLHVVSPLDGEQGKKPLHGESLLDAIGHGIPLSEETRPSQIKISAVGSSLVPRPEKEDLDWRKNVALMDAYAKAQDVLRFEHVVADILGIPRDTTEYKEWKSRRKAWKEERRDSKRRDATLSTTTTPSEQVHVSTHFDVDEEMPIPSWKWAEQKKADRMRHVLDRRLVLYLSSRLFSYIMSLKMESTPTTSTAEAQTQPKLVLRFHPPNVFHWLLWNGLIATTTIEQALLTASDRLSSTPPKLPSGAVLRAFVEYDPDFHILLSVLLGPTHLEAADIVEAIRLLVHSLGFADPSETTLLLTNGDINGDTDIDMQEASPSYQESIFTAAENDLNHALDLLSSDSTVRPRCLALALTTLHTYPPPIITSAMRTILHRHETIALIHLLRIELARDGWLSRYLDTDLPFIEDHLNGPLTSHPGEDLSPPDSSITLISTLLNCLLDSVGATGWVTPRNPSSISATTTTEDLETTETITALNAEISAALEGIEEMTYLGGLLGELLRYSAAVKANTISKPRTGSQPRRLPLPSDIEGSDDRTRSILPMGGNIPEDEKLVERKKVGAGGEIMNRSARDVGRLTSRKVAPYSVERIVL